jgi:predicted ArsR family transcriptional regulator
MNQRLIAEIGKTQRLAIINQLKRTQGLSVNELSERLQMSYMGVKQHCVELERERYLDTWRRPKSPGTMGRPEIAYRLTHRAHELFPTACNEATIEMLESARVLFGPAAPEKLLFLMFQKKAERYATRIKGDTLVERAKWLARLRDNEGCMAELETEGGLRIVEHHSPLRDLLQAFPLVGRLEAEMFQRLLGAPVRREEQAVSGLFRCTFHIGGD